MNSTIISDMDAKEANVATMAYQLKELKEASRAAQLAQKKADIKAAVTLSRLCANSVQTPYKLYKTQITVEPWLFITYF